MATVQDLIDEVEASELVLAKKTFDPSQLSDFTGFYRTRLRVLRIVSRGGSEVLRTEDYEIIHKSDKSEARWHRSTPSVLRDNLSQRDPQFSQDVIRDIIEGMDEDYQVLELNVAPRGNFDLVRATIDNLVSTFDKSYRMWKKEVGDWFMPPSDQPHRMGVLKWHNDKLWKSENDANVWEPGTPNAPWIEVDPETALVEIREVSESGGL